ncbi:hypothetical protein ACFL6X_09535, partial [Candidatus Latescibacterota bacterium]
PASGASMGPMNTRSWFVRMTLLGIGTGTDWAGAERGRHRTAVITQVTASSLSSDHRRNWEDGMYFTICIEAVALHG